MVFVSATGRAGLGNSAVDWGWVWGLLLLLYAAPLTCVIAVVVGGTWGVLHTPKRPSPEPVSEPSDQIICPTCGETNDSLSVVCARCQDELPHTARTPN